MSITKNNNNPEHHDNEYENGNENENDREEEEEEEVTTEEIPLERDTTTTRKDNDNNISTSKNTIIEEDNDIDDEVNALLNELKEEKEEKCSTEEERAIHSLLQSTTQLKNTLLDLSTTLDTQYSLSERAKSINQNVSSNIHIQNITQTASSTASSVQSLWNQLQITDTVANVANSDTVRGLATTAATTLEPIVTDGTLRLKTLNDKHKITTFTANTLKGGVDWVTQSLNSVVMGRQSQGGQSQQQFSTTNDDLDDF